MALLAESLVEEWLNREGYFTIRGIKHGLGEMDLLAVCPQPGGMVVGWHCEVTVSFRPIGYIAHESVGDSGRKGSYVRAKKRGHSYLWRYWRCPMHTQCIDKAGK